MFGRLTRKQEEAAKPLPVRIEHDFDRGQHVEVLQTAGFHRGATGVVAFVQHRGLETDRIWVDREGAGSAVWYHPSELKRVDAPNPDLTRPLTYAQPFRPSI